MSKNVHHATAASSSGDEVKELSFATNDKAAHPVSTLPRTGKGVVVGAGRQGRRVAPFRKRMLIAAGLLVAGVLLAAGGFVFYKQHQTDPVKSVCGQALLKDASAQYQAGSLTALAQVSYQIKGKPDHPYDPNCLYVLVQYDLLRGDVPSARTGMERLRSEYASYRFSSKLDDGQASLGNLQKQFDRMQRLEDNANGKIDPAI